MGGAGIAEIWRNRSGNAAEHAFGVGIGAMQNGDYNGETRRWTQLFVGLGFDTMVNLGPVPTQVGIAFHYNAVKNDLLNPQRQVRLVITPVVPAPAWARRPLCGGG